MGRWELWEREGSSNFFPDWNDQARRMAKEEGMRFTWEVEAKGANPASRALYEHLGFGEYKPMLRDDGTPYPEDEDENYVPEAGD
jgi:hypothetical protein